VAATTSSFSSELVALLNEGDGRAFVSRSLTPLDLEIPLDFISFDADGDGDADLAQSARFECPFCIDLFGFADPLRFFLNESNPPASHDRNHNRTPDECERALFHRGDPTADGLMNLSDPLAVLNFLFIGGGRPSCLETADGNNNGVVDLTDALVLLNFLFLGGPPPAAPGPTRLPCGGDPDGAGSRGDLGCISYPPCR
jgi:hypothetical protein